LTTESLSPLPDAAGADLSANCVIAIDGPAGSGKSTTAQAIAERYGFVYIDTGAMYRALTWAALEKGVPTESADDLADLLRTSELQLQRDRRKTVVVWNGQDISVAIRTTAIDAQVSAVSRHSSVRRLMVERQRELGRAGGVVMEGRDIGSVVFPLATVKIYLDASLAARVERRYRQYRQANQEVASEKIRDELLARDKQDSERTESPLTISPDACVLDTSRWSLPEQIAACTRAVGQVVWERQRTVAAAQQPEPLLLKYSWAYKSFAALSRFFGMREIWLEGRAIPKGSIIASNHVSWWDPPIVGTTLRRSRIRTLAKAELFRIPPMGQFFHFLDAIPIQRSGFDRNAFQTAIATLQQGDNICIFPEGTRRPICKPGPVRSGLGILAQETGAPIQPVFVRGTCHLEPGGSRVSPLEVWLGPLVRMYALPTLRERLTRKEITARIANLCEAIFWELQSRSFAEIPPTDWELNESERQEKAYQTKFTRLFGR
jgi:cytidylate kinase